MRTPPDGRTVGPMTPTLPRPVLYVGLPVLAALLGVALWAWSRWGLAVFFDTVSSGVSTCL